MKTIRHISSSLLSLLSLATVALLLLGACRGDEPAPYPTSTERPIRFAGSVPESRDEALDTRYDNFIVKAVKTMPDASTQVVIPLYKVLFGNNWYYEGIDEQFLKYWDLSAASYLFSAVTPTPDNSATAPIGFKDVEVSIGEDIEINNIKGNLSTGSYPNSSESPDWMVAKTQRTQSTLADVDLIEPTTALNQPRDFVSVVPLRFHPLMARAEFRVWADGLVNLQSFKVDVVDDQKIKNIGSYSTASGWHDTGYDPNENALLFCDYTYLDGRIVSTDKNNPTLLASHVQIPQTWNSTTGRKLRVTLTTKTGETYQGDITLDATTNGENQWQQGRHYVYTLHIKLDGEGSNEVILFAVDMEQWIWREGNSHEETQTNW